MAAGIIPIVRAPSSDLAMRAVDAIRAGGIDVVEVTMTVPGAVSLIDELARRFGDAVMVGAGTVLAAGTARACVIAGAAFIVRPGLAAAPIACCRTHRMAVGPRAPTP